MKNYEYEQNKNYENTKRNVKRVERIWGACKDFRRHLQWSK